jgi:uncharacterized protein YutE (UPF0331/DUF86 family)
MSSEVISKKLVSMSKYLNDLLPYREITFEMFMEKHYEIERILELIIMTASDIIFHILSVQGEPVPISYRTAFLMAGEIGIISKDLSESLALSAGLRNILVHEYEEIDYKILYKSIPIAIKDYSSFIDEISRRQQNS